MFRPDYLFYERTNQTTQKKMSEKYKHIGDPVLCLIEECSELIHILCKAQRFGWNDYHPDDKNKTPNTTRVLEEMKDVEDRIKEVKNILAKRE